MEKKEIIKVAPRPGVIRKRYAKFLTGLAGYLEGRKSKLDRNIRYRFRMNA